MVSRLKKEKAICHITGEQVSGTRKEEGVLMGDGLTEGIPVVGVIVTPRGDAERIGVLGSGLQKAPIQAAEAVGFWRSKLDVQCARCWSR